VDVATLAALQQPAGQRLLQLVERELEAMRWRWAPGCGASTPTPLLRPL
jgi:hypothetical protein